MRPDIWREDLHPRAATRARTIPLLERERERLLAELQEVLRWPFSSVAAHIQFQLENENLELQGEIASNVRQFDKNEKEAGSLLDVLDEVWMFFWFFPSFSHPAQVIQEWERLPADDMSQWSREMIQQRSMSDKSTIF